MTNTKNNWEERFKDEFVLYTGMFCEPIWQDANGSVNPVINFIRLELERERKEIVRSILKRYGDFTDGCGCCATCSLRDCLEEEYNLEQ